MKRFIQQLYSRIQLSDEARAALEELSELAKRENALIVFVTRRPSLLDAALLRRLASAFGLDIAIDRAHWPTFGWKALQPIAARASNRMTSAFLYLRGRTAGDLWIGLARQQRRLLERRILMLKTISESRPVYLVPASLFAGRGPRPWPRQLRIPIDFHWFPIADLWQLFVYRFHRRQLHLAAHTFFRLQPGVPRNAVLRELSKELYRHEKLARGVQFRSKYYVENLVLSGSALERVMTQIAINRSLSREQVFLMARKRFAEISGNINGAVVEILRATLTRPIMKIFGSLTVRGVENITEAYRRGPTVLIVSHRSHFDYLLLGWALYFHHLPLPYVAAGDNLNFFPVGRVLRSGGAFFIRRKVDNDPLYRAVLDRYMLYLIKHGHLIEFYIEGGRSRTGLTLPPRLGLLKSIVRAFERGERGEIQIVPVTVAYERLAEERAFTRERRGEKKTKEGIKDFLNARLVFRRYLGPALIRFGPALPLREFFADSALPLMPGNELSPTEHETAKNHRKRRIEDLGYQIARQLMQQHAITTTGLASLALWSEPSRKLQIHQLFERMLQIRELMDIANRAVEGSPLVFSEHFEEIMTSPAPRNALEDFLHSPLAAELFLTSEGMVSIPRGEAPTALEISSDFYRNWLLHHFVLFAIVGFTERLGSDPRELFLLFREDFLFRPYPEWQKHLEKFQSRITQELSPAGLQRACELSMMLIASHYELQSRLNPNRRAVAEKSQFLDAVQPLFEKPIAVQTELS